MFALRLSILAQKHRNPSSRSLGEKIVGDVVIGTERLTPVMQLIGLSTLSPFPHVTGFTFSCSALLSSSLMLKDPELAHFVNEPNARIWLGPGRHIVAYSIVSIHNPECLS